MNRTATIYCPNCEADRDASFEERLEEHEVRGESISLTVPLWICSICGETVVNEAYGDPVEKAFQEYRKRRKLLVPEEIARIRECYGLSREAFAALLGMSPTTLYRYEGGALQDEVHDQLIRMCRAPAMMAEVYRDRGERLTDLQRRRFEEAMLAQGVNLRLTLASAPQTQA